MPSILSPSGHVTFFCAVSVIMAPFLAVAAAASPQAEPMPFAAHNSYPYEGKGADKLERALKAGFRHVEVDVTYDSRRKAVVVTHDRKANGSEPGLAECLAPLWRELEGARDTGLTLAIDLKSSSDALVAGIDAELSRHASLLTQMEAGAGGRLRRGPLTVYLSGSGDGKSRYERLANRRGRFLAFCDRVFGDGEWKKDAAEYVPGESPGFCRFLTFHRNNFLGERRRGGVIGEGWERTKDFARGLAFWERGPDPDQTLSLARLQKVAARARQLGYGVRIYVIDSRDEWEVCVQAGIPMIATDDYEGAARWWRERLQRSSRPKDR